jgi:tetratricopeptide (TPR) repeat protein
VLTLTDVDPRFFKQSADELLQKGRVREAMAYLQKAMAIDSSHPEIANQLAWLLAAGSEANLRDGPRAVKLAKQACQLTDFKQTVFVGTLAAAYAEAGQFEEAISAAQKACALASGSGKPELLKANQERLVLYRAHQSYHEGANPDQTKP